jgi:hypothetical protein
MADRTPTLEALLRTAINSSLLEVHTMLPARVTRVDLANGRCDCQPTIKRRYDTETAVDIPVITNVPIAFYRAGAAHITLPLKVGHTVMLMFSERSLDVWLNKGGQVDPADPRKFHYSDAVAYPGLYPFDQAPSADANDIVIRNEDATIRIKPDQVELYGNGDAVALASKVMDALDDIKSTFDAHDHLGVDSLGGPVTLQPPLVPIPGAADVGSDKVKLD